MLPNCCASMRIVLIDAGMLECCYRKMGLFRISQIYVSFVLFCMLNYFITLKLQLSDVESCKSCIASCTANWNAVPMLEYRSECMGVYESQHDNLLRLDLKSWVSRYSLCYHAFLGLAATAKHTSRCPQSICSLSKVSATREHIIVLHIQCNPLFADFVGRVVHCVLKLFDA